MNTYTGRYGIVYTMRQAEAKLSLEGRYDNYFCVTVPNDTSETQYDYYIVVAAHDRDGNLVYVGSYSLDQVGIHPDSTVTIRMSIDSRMVKYWNSHDMMPATVEAYIYSEVD